jgi:hypothetical protein
LSTVPGFTLLPTPGQSHFFLKTAQPDNENNPARSTIKTDLDTLLIIRAKIKGIFQEARFGYRVSVRMI